MHGHAGMEAAQDQAAGYRGVAAEAQGLLRRAALALVEGGQDAPLQQVLSDGAVEGCVRVGMHACMRFWDWTGGRARAGMAKGSLHIFARPC